MTNRLLSLDFLVPHCIRHVYVVSHRVRQPSVYLLPLLCVATLAFRVDNVDSVGEGEVSTPAVRTRSRERKLPDNAWYRAQICPVGLIISHALPAQLTLRHATQAIYNHDSKTLHPLYLCCVLSATFSDQGVGDLPLLGGLDQSTAHPWNIQEHLRARHQQTAAGRQRLQRQEAPGERNATYDINLPNVRNAFLALA